METEATGRMLAAARTAGRKLEDYPGERPDMAQALAIQDSMAAAMGRPVLGWKVGLTSARAQALCGVDAPLAGPVFDIWESGAGIAPVEGDLALIEAEIGFRMKADLPPRDAVYGRAEVLAEVGEVLPMFEWVNKRLPGDIREAAEWLVADGVINRGLMIGAGLAFVPGMDLAGETVRVARNGEVFTDGVGANALGDPAEVLVWLANDLSARGKGLKAGDVVATGLIAELAHAEPGVEIAAEFAHLGRVALRVV